jgi:hypothetical protein
MASICCSPPDKVPAAWPLRSRRRGKVSKTRSRLLDRLSELEILPHRHIREDLAAFRHLDEARPYDVRRGCPSEELSVEADLAIVRAQDTGQNLVQRRLAHSVGTQHRDDLASADGQIKAPQHLRAAIACS